MAEAYAPVRAKQFPRLTQRETADDRYWSKLRFPTVHKETSPVTCIDFSPLKPYHYAITAGQKVTIYDSQTHEVKKNFTRFKATATSGRFRSDGKLMVAADHSGLIQVFDVNGKATLRRFHDHTKAVHAVNFATQPHHVISASDDTSVRLWDVSMETAVTTFTGHNDYVRACKPCSGSNLIVSGSYDHYATVWDPATGQAAFKVDHAGPVEAVAVINNGTLFATAGENVVKIWDLVAGGKLLSTISNHQKTITDVAFDAGGHHLFSAGLDRMLKVYSVNTWSVVHSIKYANPLLCLGVAPADSQLAAGMTTGIADVRSRSSLDSERKKRNNASNRRSRPRPGTYGYDHRGTTYQPTAVDTVVNVARKKKLRKHDQLLRKFRYAQALDAVLVDSKAPMVASVLQELIERNGLRTALSGRDDVTLQPVLHFCLKTIAQPRYTRLVTMVTEVLLDIYAGSLGLSPLVDDLFRRLGERLKQEVLLQKQLCSLMGSLELLLATAS